MNSNDLINAAYDHCRRIALDHYENFPVGSALIPRQLRKHFFALYAFMRTADDIADLQSTTSSAQRIAALDVMRRKLDSAADGDPLSDPIFIALSDTINQCRLDPAPLHRLLDAFTFDAADEIAFQTDDDLFAYTSRSAEPVGELVLALFGFRSPDHFRLSNKVCSALQLLNFVQDLNDDAARNHYYIPAQDCAIFGLTHSRLRSNSDNLKKLVLFECDKIEHLLRQGAILPELVSGRLRFELRAVLYGALAMLRLIRASGGDVISARPTLSRTRHLMLLARSFRKPKSLL